MRFEVTRLRRGEILAAAAAIILAVSLFGLPWYGLSGAVERNAAALRISTTISGWNGLTDLRWLILIAIITALALACAQGTYRAPAFPSGLSVIVTVLGVLTSLALIYRVLINVPGPGDVVSARFGAYLGLVSAFALTAGAFLSLREEDAPDPVRNAKIETIHLG